MLRARAGNANGTARPCAPSTSCGPGTRRRARPPIGGSNPKAWAMVDKSSTSCQARQQLFVGRQRVGRKRTCDAAGYGMLTPQEFILAFVARTKNFRNSTGKTQRDMADILGIPEKTYARYESRSPLPHHHISRFCLSCGISIKELFDIRHKSNRNTVQRRAAVATGRAA